MDWQANVSPLQEPFLFLAPENLNLKWLTTWIIINSKVIVSTIINLSCVLLFFQFDNGFTLVSFILLFILWIPFCFLFALFANILPTFHLYQSNLTTTVAKAACRWEIYCHKVPYWYRLDISSTLFFMVAIKLVGSITFKLPPCFKSSIVKSFVRWM